MVDCCIYLVDCWLIVVFISVFFRLCSNFGQQFAMKERKAVPRMRTDEGRGRRVWSSTKRTDEEHGGLTKSEDRRKTLTMDIGGR